MNQLYGKCGKTIDNCDMISHLDKVPTDIHLDSKLNVIRSSGQQSPALSPLSRELSNDQIQISVQDEGKETISQELANKLAKWRERSKDHVHEFDPEKATWSSGQQSPVLSPLTREQSNDQIHISVPQKAMRSRQQSPLSRELSNEQIHISVPDQVNWSSGQQSPTLLPVAGKINECNVGSSDVVGNETICHELANKLSKWRKRSEDHVTELDPEKAIWRSGQHSPALSPLARELSNDQIHISVPEYAIRSPRQHSPALSSLSRELSNEQIHISVPDKVNWSSGQQSPALLPVVRKINECNIGSSDVVGNETICHELANKLTKWRERCNDHVHELDPEKATWSSGQQSPALSPAPVPLARKRNKDHVHELDPVKAIWSSGQQSPVQWPLSRELSSDQIHLSFTDKVNLSSGQQSPALLPVARELSNDQIQISVPDKVVTRTKEDDEREYNQKVTNFNTVIMPLFNKLDNIDHVPMENIISQYLKTDYKNNDFMGWFRDVYSIDKKLYLIEEVIDIHGHNITIESMNDGYKRLIKAKNKELIDLLLSESERNEFYLQDVLFTVDHCIAAINDPLNKFKKRNSLNNNKLWEVIAKDAPYSERDKRMLMVEINLPSVEKVDFLWNLINHEELGPYLKKCYQNGDVMIEDIRQNCVEQIAFNDVINFLKRECNMCLDEFPMNNMHSFLSCCHEMCKRCFENWLKINIESEYPSKWKCPYCNDSTIVNEGLHYFNMRKFLTQCDCAQSLLELFDSKLLSEGLKKSTNFLHCVNDQCEYGFEAVGEATKIQCPACKMYMCVECKKEWKKEHDDVTCAEYEIFLLENAPISNEIISSLNIECPNCKARYDLQPGGCLHMTCRVCKWEFCGGCFNHFTKECNMDGCTMGQGFHGHHPRNCIYFLRDYDVENLENLLKDSNYPKLPPKPESKCPFLVSKNEGQKEEPCNNDVHCKTGLCLNHYKEYLIQLINKLHLDPAMTADDAQLNLYLVQGLQGTLVQGQGESAKIFSDRLRTTVVSTCDFYIPKKR